MRGLSHIQLRVAGYARTPIQGVVWAICLMRSGRVTLTYVLAISRCALDGRFRMQNSPQIQTVPALERWQSEMPNETVCPALHYVDNMNN
jgi:hypothetical protein